ncbi:MAG: bifunctional phosphoribosylaminoimidazolecarboxamide formyltransferase/IMP cyclohydrolase [Armatimonadetes bacterium]|nr:bifunctional phosphoribosylaminoimidazolecarboxamide formyltransferase/IMP cyclohydrolase [Armatimonadota bacterium]
MGIKRALISVSEKTGVVEFARGLTALGVEILSTGGTAKALTDAGVPVVPVEQATGFPEMMEGRVKTLHPKIHGGILADRSKPDHLAQAQAHGIGLIDLVCVNLYPFAATVARPDVTLEMAIENIDIGGPSMIRSAAKNHAAVTVVVDPSDYEGLLTELRNSGGEVSEATRRRLAVKAFGHTANYDAMIHAYLHQTYTRQEEAFPEYFTLANKRVQELRYGENPHQQAAFYQDVSAGEPGIGTARQRHGKELSFDNIVDADAALELVKEFELPACAVIKHTNPCGCAQAADLVTAFGRALEGDPVSAYGGIVACNRVVDVATAEAITAPGTFFELIIAPGFEDAALPILTEKKRWGADLRLLEVPGWQGSPSLVPAHRGFDLKKVVGGLLVQERDRHRLTPDQLTIVTQREPTEQEGQDLLFAWLVVKHVKSNAIVLARDGAVVGVGAGQMNRVGSVKIAVEQAGDRARGAVMASDAFFPFPDGPEVALNAGVTAIIQPGGSKKDADTIAAANAHGAAMVFTGVRHFRH